MSGSTLPSNNLPEAVQSGADIVSAFIGEMRRDSSLDQTTIEVIAKLSVEGKLTRINLLKALEQEREPRKT